MTVNEQQDQPFEDFLRMIREALHEVFHVRYDMDRIALERNMPQMVFHDIMSLNPLSVAIPSEFGGRGSKMEEIQAVLSAAGYQSLSLSLTLGINMALFLQPVNKYANEEVKLPIFQRFLQKQNLGGLMITEPGFGSDALNMRTSHTLKDGMFHLKGVKHWAGLTGWADYWLLTARRQRQSDEDLERDIDFFICDVKAPGQQIQVEEIYNNLGLYQIPYGRNRIDVQIPSSQKLIPHSSGVKMMLDLLHRSRMHIPAMALGFIQRMLDESISHAKQRSIAGKPLISFDQVQHRLATLQSYYTISSAMCLRSCKLARIENDISAEGFLANSMKVAVTDMMQQAAQSATQLLGAVAYKLDNIIGRGIVDSRPFQIFEGSNDILYSQISSNLIKMIKKTKESNLLRLVRGMDLTSKSAPYLKDVLDFHVDINMPQRKLVELGQVLSRIVSFGMVVDLGEKGYPESLINNGLSVLKQEIDSLMSSCRNTGIPLVIENYQENSSWLNFLAPKP